MNGVELFLLGRTLMKIGEEALPTEGLGECVAGEIAVGAAIGLVVGIVVSLLTDIPLAPEIGLVIGALVGWLWGRAPLTG